MDTIVEKLIEDKMLNDMRCGISQELLEMKAQRKKEIEDEVLTTKNEVKEYEAKHQVLKDELNATREGNQKTNKQLEVACASLDRLKRYLSQHLVRFQQLVRESTEVLQLKTEGKNIACEIAELKQRLNEMNSTIEIEKEAKMKSLAEELNRLRNERAALLNQSRSNDSSIAANAKHLGSSKMAFNEEQNALEQISQRRTDLQHDIELANTRRESIVQNIDDLQSAANQCAIVKENLHLLELEKTSLRKELDFQVKIARKPSSTPEQASPSSSGSFSVPKPKSDSDLMRQIMMDKADTPSVPTDTSVSDYEGYN